jgi:putative flippase GtrA
MNNRFSRFLLVGLFNTLFGWAIIFGGMYLLEMSPEASNVLGYSIGLLASFFLNRAFIFRSSGQASGELARFLAVFVLAYGANLAVLIVLVRLFFVHEAAGQLAAGVVYVISSYMMNKNFVFPEVAQRSGARS